MWHSQSIVTLNATKNILKFICIAPFRDEHHFHFIYYASVLIAFQTIFLTSFYIKLFYLGEIHSHLITYDTFYFVEQITWIVISYGFTGAIWLSMQNHSDQMELLQRMAILDSHLRLQLRVNLSYRRYNIQFIISFLLITVYLTAYFACSTYYYPINIATTIYDFCVTIAAAFLYISAFYTIFWAQAFVNRAEYIIDALKMATSQRHISKRTLTVISEAINMLFNVRESIQDAFGSILFVIIFVNSFLIAEGVFGAIHNYERNRESQAFWIDYMGWSLTLWSEFTCVIVYFSRVGDVVSDLWMAPRIIFMEMLFIHVSIQVTRIQETVSKRCEVDDKDFEDCVSASRVK